MIRMEYKTKGSDTKNFLYNLTHRKYLNRINELAQLGVEALRDATPVDTGLSAASWGYELESNKDGIMITWTNSNVKGYTPIVVWVQYGHATRNGGFVQPNDFINPAMAPVFNDIANAIWEEVRKL